MTEVHKNIAEVTRMILVNKDLLHLGPKEGEKRPYDSEVYLPPGRLGFETISLHELQDTTPPDLNAFEGSTRRNLRDSAVRVIADVSPEVGKAATTVLERALQKTSEPFPLDHTLGHLRHPDLYLTVGPPMYDTVLLGHIARTAGVALETHTDRSLDTYRARQIQVDRWRRRFSTRGEDWYGKLIAVTTDAKKLVQTGGNYAARFPVDAKTPVHLRYVLGDKGSELVVHNIRLIRQSNPNTLTEKVATDDLVRKNLDEGLILTQDVLHDPSALPSSSAILESMDFYLSFCDKMRDRVGLRGDIEAFADQQKVFEEQYAMYAR